MNLKLCAPNIAGDFDEADGLEKVKNTVRFHPTILTSNCLVGTDMLC